MGDSPNPVGCNRRHATDIAPFDLWDESKQAFRHLEREHVRWIYETVPECNGVRGLAVFVVLQCPVSPSRIFYSVGGKPAIFRQSFKDDESMAVLQRCQLGDPKIATEIPKNLFINTRHL